MILYELTTLKHPFDGMNVAALTIKIMKAQIAPIPNFYSFELKHLVGLLLEKEPKLRPTVR